ncbi:MAG: tol-pal system protein YbgF [Pseudomonadales bacterium]|nr:tol-pal system protein YbgF [Pseudomonadales bacterium]
MKKFVSSVLLVVAASAAAAPDYRPLPIEQREAAPAAVDFPQAVQYQAPATPSSSASPANQVTTPRPTAPAVESNVQWELYNQLQQLQQELAALRGLVEQQSYELNQIKQQQRQRYLDLDHRINQIKVAPPVVQSEPANNSDVPISQETIDDKKAYDQAIGLMRERKFNDAIALLEKLLEISPKSELAPNAEYWLGELYMVLDPPQLDVAKKHFITLLRDFKEHQKVPDALYKLGKLYSTQGEKDKARVTLEKVIADFPTRQAASHAKKLLAKL